MIDSTIAASPATFWAMSWMTVKVVTTRNGFLAAASSASAVERARQTPARLANPTNFSLIKARIMRRPS